MKFFGVRDENRNDERNDDCRKNPSRFEKNYVVRQSEIQTADGADCQKSVPARFGDCASQICYFRHRAPREPGSLGNASGQLNIAFADGHVKLMSTRDLVDANGRSTFEAMWSPIDREIEDANPGQ